MSNILITGGTGSFGQACVEYLLKNSMYPHGKIIIYSRDEHKQEIMARKFKELDKEEKLRFFIGDIRDKYRLKLALREASYVIHAAALKIVPTAEYNPFETVKTNVIGSQNLIDCCLDLFQCKYMKIIALSTDKAVNPINLYGATKLCMEKMMLAANNVSGEDGPKFSIVRYGNVANSNGSVIQVFKDQRDKGLPFTVTDPKMTRFWITLEEAVKFVLEKLMIMQGKEVFIPDMPSFYVGDLIAVFKTTYPYSESRLIGIRPGEKMHEQIDENRFSSNNNEWLYTEDLREILQEMGVI